MFTFNIVSRIKNPTWYIGLTEMLNTMMLGNPLWKYQWLNVCDVTHTHLIILDFTDVQDNQNLPDQDALLLSMQSGYQLLVLLKSNQQHMAHELYASACSLLFVDERQFHIRNIVELSMKQRRYISPGIERCVACAPVLPLQISFTPAEKKILEGLCRGMNGVEISKMLFRSQKTISTHKRRIMLKLGVKNDYELATKIDFFQATKN